MSARFLCLTLSAHCLVLLGLSHLAGRTEFVLLAVPLLVIAGFSALTDIRACLRRQHRVCWLTFYVNGAASYAQAPVCRDKALERLRLIWITRFALVIQMSSIELKPRRQLHWVFAAEMPADSYRKLVRQLMRDSHSQSHWF